MSRSIVGCLMFFGLLQIASGRQNPHPVKEFTHPYVFKIVSKTPIPVKDGTDAHYPAFLLFDAAITKYAITVDSANTPSAPTNVVIRSLQGGADVVLIPRDSDFAKRTVRLYDSRSKTEESFGYLNACDWSPDGAKLLVTGWNYGKDRSYPLWCIDTNTMNGIRISPSPSKGSGNGGSFSPDGKFITYTLFSRKPHQAGRRFITSVDGAKTKYLGTGDDGGSSPSSKHRLISYIDQYRSKVWVSDRDGAHKRLLFSSGYPGHNRGPKYITLCGITWLDDGLIALTATTHEELKRVDYCVWIVDAHGKVLQTMPSTSLHQIWAAQRTMILVEESSEGKNSYWKVKY